MKEKVTRNVNSWYTQKNIYCLYRLWGKQLHSRIPVKFADLDRLNKQFLEELGLKVKAGDLTMKYKFAQDNGEILFNLNEDLILLSYLWKLESAFNGSFLPDLERVSSNALSELEFYRFSKDEYLNFKGMLRRIRINHKNEHMNPIIEETPKVRNNTRPIMAGFLMIFIDDEDRIFPMELKTPESKNGDMCIEQIEFNVKDIFALVCNTLSMQSDLPNSWEEFHRSPIWKTLGFDIKDSSRVKRIVKYIATSREGSLGQEAKLAVDFKSKKVVYDKTAQYWNRLDDIICLWPKYYLTGAVVDGWSIIRQLVKILCEYYEKKATQLDVLKATQQYLEPLHDEKGQVIDEDKIQQVFGVLKSFLS